VLEACGAGEPPRSADALEQTIDALLDLARSEDAVVRRGAIAVLARIPEAELSTDPFRDALEDRDPQVRREAVIGRSRHELATNWESIVRAARDEDASVRAAAAQALGDVKRPEARTTLASLLADPSDDVVDAAAAVFARRLTQAPPPAVFAAVHSERPRVRAAAARIFGDCHAAECLVPLAGLLDDTAWIVRREAIRQLARFPTPAACARVAAVAQDGTRSRTDRFEALQALAHMESAPDVEPIALTAVKDPDPVLRLVAARTLLSRGDPRACPTLVNLLSTETGPHCDFEDRKFVRTTAAATLRAATGAAFGDADVEGWRRIAAEFSQRTREPEFTYSPEYLPERW
jgi:HEAT repeat protein